MCYDAHPEGECLRPVREPARATMHRRPIAVINRLAPVPDAP
jgi:hypothetical protein